MCSYCLRALAVLAVIIGLGSRPALGQESSRKLYSDDLLVKARKDLQDYRFKDAKLAAVFARDNREIVAVLLEVNRERNVIREIAIFSRTAKDKRLTPVRTLGKRDDPDFQALVDKLKL